MEAYYTSSGDVVIYIDPRLAKSMSDEKDDEEETLSSPLIDIFFSMFYKRECVKTCDENV